MDINGFTQLLMAFAFFPAVTGISLKGSSTTALLGQSFQFTCTVTNSSIQTVIFKKDNNLVCTALYMKCQQHSATQGYNCSCLRSDVYYMNITSVNQTDDGIWTCQHSQTSNNITLPVYYGPFNNVTVDKTSPVTVTEDASVFLTARCSAVCKPACSYTWMKGTLQLSESRYLPVGSFRRGQEGDYLCTAVNTATGETADSQTLTVNVQYSPRPVSERPTCTVVFEKRMPFASLRVDVTANPLPNFTWFKHSSHQMPVVNGTESLILSIGLSSTLTVLIKSEDDDTNYSVVVENSLGNTTLFCSLTEDVSPVQKSTVPKVDIIPVVAGVGAAALVILIIVIIVILHRRGVLKGNSNKNDCPTQQGDSAHAIDNVYLEGDDGLKCGRDEDGLMYVGVEFGNQATPTAAPECTDEATEYAGIAHGVVGCPLPPDKEDEKK